MLGEIVVPLLSWYADHKRTLPWRERKDPYHIWVSEIMLQQTRVEAVKPYFQRFIRQLPDTAALAACPEERLLKLWEGLGYYNRVRNMQKAARILQASYEGKLPETAEELKKLPGIGSYTAGAIASIAYGQPVPAVDGNVLRILSRLRMDAREINKEKVKKEVETELAEVMPEKEAGSFNQALMDLGAGICLPNGTPLCGDCPLRELCAAHREGAEEDFPRKEKKKPRRIEKRTILLIRDGERIALQQRPEKGLLAGMYEFPNLEGWLSEQEALDLAGQRGFLPVRIKALPDAVHIFTHIEWRMIGYEIRVAALDEDHSGGLLLAELQRIREQYPLPSAYRVYMEQL